LRGSGRFLETGPLAARAPSEGASWTEHHLQGTGVEEPCTGGVTAWRGAPYRSQPPRGGLTFSRLGQSGSLSRRPGPASAERRPSSTSPSPLGPHSLAAQPSPVQLILRGHYTTFLLATPYACSGCCGRRLPGGALPRGRQRPSLKPNTLSTRSLERLAAGRYAPEPPTAPPRSRRALRPRAAASSPQPPFARRGGPTRLGWEVR
jgi:hypothetical protein